MKNFFLLSLFLLTSLGSKAQVADSWPDSNAVWVNTLHQIHGPSGWNRSLIGIDNYCMGNTDTTLSGKSYQQIHWCDSLYKGALRHDSGRVYFWPADSSREYLLYDFEAKLGDTLRDVYMEGWYGVYPEILDLYVHQLDTFMDNGKQQRLIYLSNDIWGSGTWIANVGCWQGLFINPFPNISALDPVLKCHSQSGGQVYPDTDTVPCKKLVFSREDPSLASGPTIFPNPADDHLNLRMSNSVQYKTLSIYSLTGEELFHLDVSGRTEVEIPTTGLPTGVYVIQLEGDAYFRTRFSVIRN